MLLAGLILATLPGCHRESEPHRRGEIFDAGAVFASSTPTLTHAFRIGNTTRRTVRILGENHSCDCTTVDLPKRELRPGESVALTLSVRVPPTYVRKEVSATLETDDPEHPHWDYLVRFEAFPDARVVPQVIDLGSHTVADMLASEPSHDVTESEACLEVYTLPNGKNRPPPRLVQVPAECVATMAQAPEVSQLASGVRAERYRLSVRLKQGMPSTGTFVRPLNVKLNDERGTSASLTWSVRAPVVCAPERIHLGSVATEDPPIKRRVILHASDGTPFRILAIGHDASVTVRPAEGGGFPSPASSRQAIELVFDAPPKEASRFLAGSVRIRIDRKDYPQVSLPWSAIVRARQAEPSRRKGEKLAIGS